MFAVAVEGFVPYPGLFLASGFEFLPLEGVFFSPALRFKKRVTLRVENFDFFSWFCEFTFDHQSATHLDRPKISIHRLVLGRKIEGYFILLDTLSPCLSH